ncbi:MAG: response regulator transcription factor [Deltaproteobacteria bacterium]|nr:response regulator transcription factor [Deltaproteobacteria bacterium]
MRVLIAEDEINLAQGLCFNLEQEGLEVHSVISGEEALAQYAAYDLLVLDIGLPGIDGFEVLRRIREHDERFPVIVLTARAAEDDRVAGLALGADDYITKPFSLKEFLLRVRGKLRQVGWYTGSGRHGPVKVGAALFDLDRQTVTREGREERTTVREQALVQYFLDHPNQALSRDDLLREVWGYTAGTASRTPDTFVARLRKLVEVDPANPRHIVSVRGKGYLFSPDGTG